MIPYLLFTSLAFGHSGGTDAYGCHAGSQPYHCHNPKFYAPIETYEARIYREAEERKVGQQLARLQYLSELKQSEYAKCRAPREKWYEYMNKEDWDAFDKQAKVVEAFDEVGCMQTVVNTIEVEMCEIWQERYSWPLGFTTHTILEELSVPTNALRQKWAKWYKTATFYPKSGHSTHEGKTLHEGFYLRDNFWIVVDSGGTVDVEYHELEDNPFGLGDNFVGTIEGVSGTMYWLVMDMQGNGHKLQVKESSLVTEAPCHQIRSK
jgi:hypothetical protein